MECLHVTSLVNPKNESKWNQIVIENEIQEYFNVIQNILVADQYRYTLKFRSSQRQSEW